MSTASARTADQTLTIRRAQPADVEVCGHICYNAFTTLNKHHNFPPDFPSPDVAIEVISMMFSHPGFFCVVAEQDGKIIGSNCLDERSVIAGIGPVTIDPSAQNRSVGRQLMLAVMDRAAPLGCGSCKPLFTPVPCLFTPSWASTFANLW